MDTTSTTKFNNNNNKYDTNLSLKQQVMLNQLASIAGCSYEQAYQLLLTANWQYQVIIYIIIIITTSNYVKNMIF